MQDFIEWYHQDFVAEADAPPDPTVYKPKYRVPGKFGRGLQNWLGKMSGGGGGEVDWEARRAANVTDRQRWQDELARSQQKDQQQTPLDDRRGKQDIGIDQRQQSQDIGSQGRQAGEKLGYGQPDDPKVREKKATQLSQDFNDTLAKLASGASPETLEVIGRATQELANAFVGYPKGQPIGPAPIEDMLRAVHRDSGMDKRMRRVYWAHHGPILDHLLRVFYKSPNVWYDPTERTYFPPGTEIDKDKFLSQASSWEAGDEDNATRKATDRNVIALLRNFIDPAIWKGKIDIATIKRKLSEFENTIKRTGGNPVINTDELMDYLNDLGLAAPTPPSPTP